MLGDSMRRRRGMRDRSREASPHDDRTGRARGTSSGMRPLHWLGGGVLAIAIAFGLGYLIATMVLFPRPALAGDEVAVPDLVGLELRDARAALDAVGLRVGEQREIAAPGRAVGVVIAQAPVAGQRLRPGAEVRLGISSGTPTVVVPDLIGMPVEGATLLARQIGLEVERRDEVSDEPAGQVLRTRPGAGARLEAPSTIVLFVSLGPPPAVDSLDTVLDSMLDPSWDL